MFSFLRNSLLFFGFCAAFSSCKTAFIRTVIYNDPGINDLKIMPTRTVKAGEKISIPHAQSYNRAVLPDSLQWSLKQTKTVAFLVLKRDSLVYEWYAKGYSDSSYTNPFSATKSIVGALTGVALREGKIRSLDESVADYLPDYCDLKREGITFRHLLTMSSGMNYYDDFYNPFGKLAQIHYGRNMRKFINKLKQEKPAGTEWRYKNSDTQVLSLALENAVGMNMSDYASEKLWKPIGAEHDGKWVIDDQPNAVEKSYCCLYTNARDLAKVGMLYKHSGNTNGLQLVDSSYVCDALTPVNLPHGSHKGKIQTQYGFMWWLRNVDGQGDFSMDGLRGQYVAVLPKDDIIIVRLGVKDWYKNSKRFKENAHLYPTIVRTVRAVWGEK